MGNPDDSAAWAADDRRCKMRSATCVDVYCRQVYRVEGAQRERRDRGHRRRYRIHQETSARSLAAMLSGFAPLLACRARRFAGPSSWVAQPCPGPTKPSNPTTARWCCGATAPRVAVANPRCPQCTAKTARTRAGSSWGGRVRACRTRTRTRRGRLGRRDSRHGRRPRRPPAGHCGPFPPAAPSPWPGARFSRWPPACPPWGTEQHDPISRARSSAVFPGAQNFVLAIAGGCQATFDDLRLSGRDWGFRTTDGAAPVRWWRRSRTCPTPTSSDVRVRATSADSPRPARSRCFSGKRCETR